MRELFMLIFSVVFQGDKTKQFEEIAFGESLAQVRKTRRNLIKVLAKINSDNYRRKSRRRSSTFCDSAYTGRYNRTILLYNLLRPDKLYASYCCLIL